MQNLHVTITVFQLDDGRHKVVFYHPSTGVSGWAIQPTLIAAKSMAKAAFIQEFNGVVDIDEDEVVELAEKAEEDRPDPIKPEPLQYS